MGPTPEPAVALNVPVKGGVPLEKDAVPTELTMVLTKWSRNDPCRLYRFNTLPFGAFRLIMISDIHVWFICRVTSIFFMMAPGGRLLTSAVVTPVELSLGMAT